MTSDSSTGKGKSWFIGHVSGDQYPVLIKNARCMASLYERNMQKERLGKPSRKRSIIALSENRDHNPNVTVKLITVMSI